MNTEHINNITRDNITPIIDELILRSYIYNRQRSPELPVSLYADERAYGANAYLYEIEMQRRLKK